MSARRHGFGVEAEEGDRELARDGGELALDEVEEFVQALAQDVVDAERAEHGAQAVELLGGVVAAAQRVAGFELDQQLLGLAARNRRPSAEIAG